MSITDLADDLLMSCFGFPSAEGGFILGGKIGGHFSVSLNLESSDCVLSSGGNPASYKNAKMPFT